MSGTREQLHDKRLAVLEDLHSFVTQIKDEDLEGAKAKLYGDIALNLESPLGINQSLVSNEVFTGNFHFEYDYLLRLKNVDKAQIQKAVENYFCPTKLTYCEYYPTKKQKGEQKGEQGVQKAVPQKQFLGKTASPASGESFQLANGLTVVYKNKPTQNIHLTLPL